MQDTRTALTTSWGLYEASRHLPKSHSGWIRRDRKYYEHTTCTVFITACKRSLRRLCFNTCLSVILFTGGCLPQCMLGHTPPWADAPQEQTPPEAVTLLHSVCWEIRATSGQYASYWNAYLFWHVQCSCKVLAFVFWFFCVFNDANSRHISTFSFFNKQKRELALPWWPCQMARAEGGSRFFLWTFPRIVWCLRCKLLCHIVLTFRHKACSPVNKIYCLKCCHHQFI